MQTSRVPRDVEAGAGPGRWPRGCAERIDPGHCLLTEIQGELPEVLGMGHCPASKIFPGLEERSRHFPSRLGPHMPPRPGAAEGTIAMVGVPLRLGCWLHHGATSTRMPSPAPPHDPPV